MRRLKVTAVKGYTSRKLDFISQNDPFIKFTMQGHDVQYTSTKENEDIPEWNQTFQFTQQSNNKLNLNVFDKDQLISQSIGSGQIDLGPYFASNQAASVYVRIFENGVPAGKILLYITPENASITPQKILSNQDINYYKASKHYKYQNDFQAQGNILSQLIQQQMKSIGKLNQNNQLINKSPAYQANLYNNQTFNTANNRYNNTNYKYRTEPAQLSHQYSQQKHFGQISNQSKMIYVNNLRPQSQFINERTINSRQIVNQSDYYQNNNKIYQYPINQIRTPIKISYQQSAQPYAQQNTVYYHSPPKTYTNAFYKTQNSTIYPQSRVIYSNSSVHSNYNFISPPQPPSYPSYWAKT